MLVIALALPCDGAARESAQVLREAEEIQRADFRTPLAPARFIAALKSAAARDRDDWHLVATGRANTYYESWLGYWIEADRQGGLSQVSIYGDTHASDLGREFFQKTAAKIATTLGALVSPRFSFSTGMESVSARGVLWAPGALARAVAKDRWLHLKPVHTSRGVVFLSSVFRTRLSATADEGSGTCDIYVVTDVPETAEAFIRQVEAESIPEVGITVITEEDAIRQDIEDEVRRRVSAAVDAVYAAGGAPSIDVASVRAEVEGERRYKQALATAVGKYVIQFRVTDDYRPILLQWYELVAFETPATFKERHLLASITRESVSRRPSAELESIELTLKLARGKFYQLSLSGILKGGKSAALDERFYVFDGRALVEQ
jgi:hypothetical protein